MSSRSGVPSEGCTSLVGFGAGAIAVVDRGGCPFATKVANAEAAGAIAVIVVNNEASQPIVMGAANDTATITAVMVSQTDGAAIKDGLPADGTVGLIPPDPVFPNVLEVDPPSSAAGSYGLAGANFGPPLSPAGVSGQLELVDDGSDDPTRGCNPLIGFPAGSIAVIDRGDCNFTTKVGNAQAAGAIAVVIVNDLPGSPTQMGGADPGIVIPSGMVSQSDGDLIRAGLPATGMLRANE